MTDFTSWLYIHYIKPYLEDCPAHQYASAMSLTSELNTWQREDFDRALEFWASRAFWLGLKTGAGLKDGLV